MLVLSHNQSAAPTFADSRDAALLYALPSALAVARDPAGKPVFMLLSYRDGSGEAQGGVLQLRLMFAPLAEQATPSAAAVRMVSFERGFFRLRLRSLLDGADEQAGEWRRAVFAGGELATITVELSTIELGLLQPLLADGRAVVEVELELHYRGLVPGVPWLATADLANLHGALAALLPGPASADEIAAAFLSLPDREDVLRWQALDETVPMPERELLLRQLARHTLDDLFVRQASEPRAATHYLLRDAEALTYSWDLSLARQEERSYRLDWSVASLPEFADPQQRNMLFPIASGLDMFGGAEVYVLNELPIDASAIRQTWADLRFPTAAGVFTTRRVQFAGTTSTAKLAITFPSIVQDFQIEYRTGALIAPAGGAGWPQILQRDAVTMRERIVRISRETTGIDIVRVEAELRVFASAAAVEVELRASGSDSGDAPLAHVRLSAQQPSAWVALPGHDLHAPITARCVAVPPAGMEREAFVLSDGEVRDRTVAIGAHQLEVPPLDRLAITLDPALAPRLAYTAIELTHVAAPDATTTGRRVSLDPAATLIWFVQRSNVFAPLQLQYRVSFVARDLAGTAQPMATTGWLPHEGTALLVQPPLDRAK
ncbi:MAG: hypothetical protein H7Z42_21465 [Roseiflexaceae bacterium]|nr:hypothetical protein [Roseiflexaceae bacterium]